MILFATTEVVNIRTEARKGSNFKGKGKETVEDVEDEGVQRKKQVFE